MVVVADTHLSARTPEALDNWETVAVAIDQQRPDLVLHLGDASLDGSSADDDLRLVRDLLDALPVPWRAIPGNHDVGDNPNPATPAEFNIRPDRLDAWRRLLGPDYWTAELDGWTVVAVDAQLIGSGLPAEDEQWAWLDATMAATPPDRPVLLATHKPIMAPDEELAAAPAHRFVASPGRERLIGLLGAHTVRAVVSGHVHQYRQLRSGDQHHVWAPTTWAVVPSQPMFGEKRCGLLSLTLGPDAGVESHLVEPPGIAQLVLGETTPNPYGD